MHASQHIVWGCVFLTVLRRAMFGELGVGSYIVNVWEGMRLLLRILRCPCKFVRDP